MKTTSFTLIVLLFFLFNSCKNDKYHVFEGFAQGTTFRMVYKYSENQNDTIMGMLKYFDQSLSLYQENSLISRINRNDSTVVLNDLFTEFFSKSREVFEHSDGYFDITVAPLVQTWGFGPQETIKTDSASIDSIMAFIGMDKIRIENGKIVKSDERVKIDGNAIAQGQSVDYISVYLEKLGITNYLVEIGGEVRAKGVNKEGIPWRIGIDKPIEGSDEENRELQTIIQLKNKSLATSGNYRKFHLLDGIKYSHSINPKTGYPSRDILLSATIIADECSIADAYATACMVMGFEKAKVLLQNKKNIEGYLIYSDKNGKLEIHKTLGFQEFISN